MTFVDCEKYRSCCGIYKITNTVNSMVYIGQTRNNFIKRYWHHQWKLNAGSHDNCYLQSDWNIYGEQCFVFEVVEVFENEEYINNAEMKYIREQRKCGLCYNISDGGDGKRGNPMSEHAKAIVGMKNREHNLGKHASDATKQKMSALRIGKKRPAETMKALHDSRVGSHHSDASRKKMSDAKIRASINGDCVLNVDTVKMIKEMLIDGMTIKAISDLLNVAYHNVKSVKYCKAWNHVYVDGWGEYVASNK